MGVLTSLRFAPLTTCPICRFSTRRNSLNLLGSITTDRPLVSQKLFISADSAILRYRYASVE